MHQTSQLVIGIIAGGGGLFILLGTLYGCLKGKDALREARQPLLSSIAFIALGITHLSRAFDWPHQASHRTQMIGRPALAVLYVTIVLLIILNRAGKKARADVGIIAPGEHKA